METGSSVFLNDEPQPLGPLGREQFAKPARVVQRGMYGIVATALEPNRGDQDTN